MWQQNAGILDVPGRAQPFQRVPLVSGLEEKACWCESLPRKFPTSRSVPFLRGLCGVDMNAGLGEHEHENLHPSNGACKSSSYKLPNGGSKGQHRPCPGWLPYGNARVRVRSPPARPQGLCQEDSGLWRQKPSPGPLSASEPREGWPRSSLSWEMSGAEEKTVDRHLE